MAAVNTLTQDEWTSEADRKRSYSKNVGSVGPAGFFSLKRFSLNETVVVFSLCHHISTFLSQAVRC